MNRVVLIGGVTSTEKVLLKLIQFDIEVIVVFGYEPKSITNVSGYRNMQSICLENKINYIPFVKINEEKNVEMLKELSPDVIFAVGFSQLLSKEIIKIPTKGIIGFHPTMLPRGRGRAPISWIVLKEKEGAANFFLLGKGIDDGPIFIQEKFTCQENDDATTIERKMLKSIEIALDKWLPSFKKGEWNPIPQEDNLAYEYGKRAPLDGVINWNNSAIEIHRLIRASTHPHPGAITFYGDYKIKVWKSRVEENDAISGVIGRVLRIEENEILIQTGNGLLWLNDFEIIADDFNTEFKTPVVGSMLGYYNQFEIYKLRNQIKKINKKLDELSKN